MNPLLARGDTPWPLIIFAVVVAFQVGAAIWQRIRRELESNDPERPDGISPSRRIGEPTNPVADRPYAPFERPLTDEERTARMERQLRGDRNWRGNPPPLPAPPPMDEFSLESGPGPSTENWVNFEEAAAAMREAHERLAQGNAVASEYPLSLSEATAALKDASDRLAKGDAAVSNPGAPRGATSTARRPNLSLAAEMARSFREPATARGAVIAAILLGRPKSLEE